MTGLALILAGLYTFTRGGASSTALVEEGGAEDGGKKKEGRRAAAGEGGADDSDDSDDEMPDGLSKKERKKWAKARDKKRAALAREQDADARLSKQASRDAKYRKRDEEREAREREEEEQAAAAAAAAAADAAKEFDEWKTMFSVDGTGETAADAVDEESLLTKFETHIKQRKVVILEDLATDFKMSGQAVRERLDALIEMGRLDGVLDDRGKFIYITPAEFDAVAAYVKEEGRVSVSVSCLLCTVTFNANHAHNLTRSP